MESNGSIEALLEFDRTHIWHPYTSMINPQPVYPVRSAHGCIITLEDGRQLVDGMASWWAAIHGYGVQPIQQAIVRQLDAMAHVMFGGLTHRPAVDLADQLVRLTPSGLDKVFLCDSGSVSVEVAIKMAIQYWHAQGATQKNRLVTVRSGYHGDTFGAMAVCDPVNGMHQMFSGVLTAHFFADPPSCRFGSPCRDADMESLNRIIEAHHHSIAAMIIEPVVQGAGGMRFYAPEYLDRARGLCDQYDILLIFDEIATGFGRTGKLFATDHTRIEPDILCLGKALTGGTMTLAATLATAAVAQGIGADGSGVLMHGPTFMGNPLACSAANASIDLLLATDWQARVQAIEAQLLAELAPCTAMPQVLDVRVLGAIGVVELTAPVEMARVQEAFVNAGVWVRPFGRLVYIMPPYIISSEQLSRLTAAMQQVIATHCRA